MHKKHNSHHIFVLLGILILLFLIIFGIRYFQSQYSFGKNDITIDNTQNYEDGVNTQNPFSNPSEEDKKEEREIIPITDPNIENYVPGDSE